MFLNLIYASAKLTKEGHPITILEAIIAGVVSFGVFSILPAWVLTAIAAAIVGTAPTFGVVATLTAIIDGIWNVKALGAIARYDWKS